MAREFEAADLRRRDQYDRDVTQAWMAVAIYGQALSPRGMPELETLLSPAKDRHKQQHDRMLSQLKKLSAITGFPLKPVAKDTWPIH